MSPGVRPRRQRLVSPKFRYENESPKKPLHFLQIQFFKSAFADNQVGKSIQDADHDPGNRPTQEQEVDGGVKRQDKGNPEDAEAASPQKGVDCRR